MLGFAGSLGQPRVLKRVRIVVVGKCQSVNQAPKKQTASGEFFQSKIKPDWGKKGRKNLAEIARFHKKT